MKRRVLAMAAVTVVAGWANAQSPNQSPATKVPVSETGKDAAPETGTMLLRTSGQPDRKVKIVKSTKSADGRVITEVKDIATGETLLVANQAASKKSALPAPAPSTKPTTFISDIKGPPMPMISNAKSREVETSAITSNEKIATSSSVPKSKSRDVDPLLNGMTVGTPAAMTSMAKPIPADSIELDPVRAKRSFQAMENKPQPKTREMPSAVTPAITPVAVSKAPGFLPAVTVAKTNSPMHVVLPVGYVPAEIRMKEETAHSIAALQSASRPTIRMDAASALADGRFGSAMEVKMMLANAAMHDPAPVVRSHCITCLSKLGYTSPEYVGYLRQCSFDLDHGVKCAASEAMTKLEPRN